MNVKRTTQTQMLPLRSPLEGTTVDAADASATPSITIFTLPKPFDDPHIACIQRNAIASWQALGESVEVILIGDEAGIAETADELGTIHVGHVQRNEHGTPLVSDAFNIALASSQAEVLVFCNADVILLHDFKLSLIHI